MEHRTGAIIGTAARRVGILSDGGTTAAAALVGPGSYDVPPLPAGRAFTFPRESSSAFASAQIDMDVPGPGLYNLGEALDASSAQRRPQAALLGMSGPRFGATAGEGERRAFQAPAPTVRRNQAAAAPRSLAPRGVRWVTTRKGRNREAFSHVGPGSYEVQTPGGVNGTTTGGFIAQAPRTTDANGGGGGIADIEGKGWTPCRVLAPTRQPPTTPTWRESKRASAPAVASADWHRPRRASRRQSPPAFKKRTSQAPERTCLQLTAVHGGVRGVVFGSASRQSPEAADAASTGATTVGPGTYEVQYDAQEKSAPRVVFGTAPRLPSVAMDGEQDLPGPGSYSPRDGEGAGGGGGGPAALFGTAPRDPTNEQAGPDGAAAVPGPGTYEVYVTREGRVLWRDVKGAVSFGKQGSSRADAVASGANGVPGPGAYQPVPTDASGPPSHGVVFGTGPGHDVRVRAADGGEHGGEGAMLGPGAYDVKYAASQPQPPAYSFGKAPAPSQADEEKAQRGEAPSPGPGTYLAIPSVERLAHHAARFGTSARFPAEGRRRGGRG
ncbi:collagen alpha-1(I) chain-like [Bactrocera neohumeralis]|uniref:collagen alpha-1(I) chain-like n=1 Tax=Bactrocera neohumeralis TaxID=98809 RepID=UPI00216546FA|nr:collagen alpha-1(I) chain-like [Bactrocera neohumeralis]